MIVVNLTPEGSEKLAGGKRSDTPGFVAPRSISTPEGSQRLSGERAFMISQHCRLLAPLRDAIPFS